MKIKSAQMSSKVLLHCGNPPLCSGIIEVPSGPKSHIFTVILAVFAPQPRWRHKPWKGLFASKNLLFLLIFFLLDKNRTLTPTSMVIWNFMIDFYRFQIPVNWFLLDIYQQRSILIDFRNYRHVTPFMECPYDSSLFEILNLHRKIPCCLVSAGQNKSPESS